MITSMLCCFQQKFFTIPRYLYLKCVHLRHILFSSYTFPDFTSCLLSWRFYPYPGTNATEYCKKKIITKDGVNQIVCKMILEQKSKTTIMA